MKKRCTLLRRTLFGSNFGHFSTRRVIEFGNETPGNKTRGVSVEMDKVSMNDLGREGRTDTPTLAGTETNGKKHETWNTPVKAEDNNTDEQIVNIDELEALTNTLRMVQLED